MPSSNLQPPPSPREETHLVCGVCGGALIKRGLHYYHMSGHDQTETICLHPTEPKVKGT